MFSLLQITEHLWAPGDKPIVDQQLEFVAQLRTRQEADQCSRNGWQTDKQLTGMRRLDNDVQVFFVRLFRENFEQFSHR
jgi:hypothetical protein